LLGISRSAQRRSRADGDESETARAVRVLGRAVIVRIPAAFPSLSRGTAVADGTAGRFTMTATRMRWLGLLVAAVLAGPSWAGTLGLSWNAAPGASGYKVYYGTQSGVYTSSIDVKNVTSTSINTLSDCTPWFLAVKAYNFAGESDQFSQEVTSWPRPVITTLSPNAAIQGAQVVVNLTGSNFQPGSSVTVDNPDVHIDSVSMTSCTSAQLLATVEPTAQNVRPALVGRFTLSVTNPQSVQGSKVQGFEVVVNQARFDVNQSDEATAGRLDGMDTVWLSRLFGASEGGPTYDPDYDFDGDGWVDGSDLSYLAGNIGKCWTGSSWNALACD
jgi:hypothetical protein